MLLRSSSHFSSCESSQKLLNVTQANATNLIKHKTGEMKCLLEEGENEFKILKTR